MKNFTKKIKRKSILVLLSLFTVFFLLSVTFTMSKYVIEKQAGTLTLNVTGADVLLPGLQLRNTLGESVTEVVFGRTEDYKSKIVGLEAKKVDVNNKGNIELYVDGTKAYILSNRKIYANPDSYQMFYNLNNLTAVNFSNFDTGIVTNMGYMFFGCDKLTDINVSSWNTERVRNMRYLFFGCSSLTSLDLSRWNTKRVEDLDGVFYNCKGLTLTFRNGIFPPLRISASLSITVLLLLRLTFRNGILPPLLICTIYFTVVLLLLRLTFPAGI